MRDRPVFHPTGLLAGLRSEYSEGMWKMEKKNVFSFIYQKICKDTGNQNESAKLVIVVRMLTLTMITYSMANCIFFMLASDQAGMIFCQISMLLFLALFVVSYSWRAFASYCVFNCSALLWVIIYVWMYGWNVGVQTYFFILIVFCFFARSRHRATKVLYVIVLLALRMSMYFYCQNYPVKITMSADLMFALQLCNTIAIFLSLSLLAYFFSEDTQTLEWKLIEYNKKLQEQVSIDPLTGLHNRRSTIEYLDGLLKSSNNQISICLCDIDFFKKVNDTYGHNVGDIVLTKIAEMFKSQLPGDTFVSRWGGEEFLLIFPTSNGDEAYFALETLRQKIKAIEFEGGSARFSVSLTFGLIEYDFHSDLTALLKEADEKLYYGKENGRDRIIF